MTNPQFSDPETWHDQRPSHAPVPAAVLSAAELEQELWEARISAAERNMHEQSAESEIEWFAADDEWRAAHNAMLQSKHDFQSVDRDAPTVVQRAQVWNIIASDILNGASNV